MHESGVSASLRTIQRVLRDSEIMNFERPNVRSKLEPHLVSARLKWSKEHSFYSVRQWKRTLFTDEKRFCLDDPDGHACYWRDKRLPKAVFSKRPKGGGCVMIWGGISWRGMTPLVIIKDKVDAVKYAEMLEEIVAPWCEETYPNGFTFQQDGAPSHTALHTKEFFMDMSWNVMDWPARSPDMNCIENAWGALVRAVYNGGRQFDTVDDLVEALLYEWEHLDMDYIRSLISSMPRRVWQLYQKRGNETKY